MKASQSVLRLLGKLFCRIGLHWREIGYGQGFTVVTCYRCYTELEEPVITNQELYDAFR